MANIILCGQKEVGPDYRVAYAKGESPLGPFKRIDKILQLNPKIATGAGHHSVIAIPEQDKWYIVYHRRPLTETDGNSREVCIDKMEFDANGYKTGEHNYERSEICAMSFSIGTVE